MSKLKTFLKTFFGKIEAIDCDAVQKEMIDGKAFTYRQYSLNAVTVMPSDTVTAVVCQDDGERFSVSETIGRDMMIDTVAIFRCKEAFGMTDCIGAVFGKSK